MKPTKRDVRLAAERIVAARPEWDIWPVMQALNYAIGANYAGTQDVATFSACACYVGARPGRQTIISMRWPEPWREAMQLLAADQ